MRVFTIDLGKVLFHASFAAKDIQKAHEAFEAGEWDGDSEDLFAASLLMMEECSKAYRQHYQDLFSYQSSTGNHEDWK